MRLFREAIRLDIPSTPVSAFLPSLRHWSEDASNRIDYTMIPALWESYDVITFLADHRLYHPSLYDDLDIREKEQVKKFKTGYFKKRFTISRSVLKHIIQSMQEAEYPSDIVLDKDKRGRILIQHIPDIFVSLSYSGSLIAITVGKHKIGSDLEGVRMVPPKKITACPIFTNKPYMNKKEHRVQVIHVWTLVESFAKLYDKNPYPLLNTCSFFHEAHFVSYCIDRHSILTLASGQEQCSGALVWLDISGRKETSHRTDTPITDAGDMSALAGRE